jgi:hypothetical protein
MIEARVVAIVIAIILVTKRLNGCRSPFAGDVSQNLDPCAADCEASKLNQRQFMRNNVPLICKILSAPRPEL